MKKFMTICGILAAALIVIGLLIAVPTATIQGASSVSKIVDEVTEGKVHVGLTGKDGIGVTIMDKSLGFLKEDGIYDLDMNLHFMDGFDIFTGDVKKSFEADTIKNISIEAGGCEMTVKPSTDGTIRLETLGIHKAQGYVKDDTLFVKGVGKGNITHSANVITLYVPEGKNFDDVEIELGAGTLELSELHAKEAELEIGAGTIECNGSFEAQEASVQVGMGALLLADMDIAQLEAEVGMGSLDLKGRITENASFECSMGNIDVKLAGSRTDYNFDLESAMGEVTIGEESVSGLVGDKKINNDAPCNITLECSMGNIDITFEE